MVMSTNDSETHIAFSLVPLPPSWHAIYCVFLWVLSKEAIISRVRLTRKIRRVFYLYFDDCNMQKWYKKISRETTLPRSRERKRTEKKETIEQNNFIRQISLPLQLSKE